MSKLKAVKPKSAEPSKPKILVFGKAGVGKTFTSLDFPKCYYIDSENGASRSHYTDKLDKAGGVYLGVEQGSQDFDEVIAQVKALTTEKHDHKTLIIDSITKLFNIEIAKEMDRLQDKNKEDAFGLSKKPAVKKTRQLLNWLDKIDMNVILIAHEKALWSDGKQVGVTYDAWEKLEYELDLVFNIIKQGDTRKALIKKSRLTGFPDGGNFDWSYTEFAKRYGAEVIERQTEAVTLATPEQLAELKGLLENWKAPEGWEDKVLAAAKCDKFEEMTTVQIANTIGFIKTKLNVTKESK
jgi:hypothetical protein